jgi:hypothetical protein
MNFTCIHCQRAFSITVDQLGGKGYCPHCRGEITLPKAEAAPGAEVETSSPGLWAVRDWINNSISAFGSMVFHLALFLILALITYGSGDGVGDVGEFAIGTLPGVQLTDSSEESLSIEAVESSPSAAEEMDASLEVESPVESSTSDTIEIALTPVSPSSAGGGAGSDTGFDINATASAGGSSLGGGSFGDLVQQLRSTGLEIVIVFDSTGSMGGEIETVKRQVSGIGGTLFKLVPNTKISICTYRDDGDEYEAKGQKLTSNLTDVRSFLDTIYAGGGGDHPEAVHAGLAWAVKNNDYQSRARKVILLFGDAPPHSDKTSTCVKIAADFRKKQNGIVSTVTCRAGSPMPEFVEIAQAGGGEAFVITNQREIMTQLIVLAFGSKHRDKVLEAFKLMER